VRSSHAPPATWGKALNTVRAAGSRTTEEIDIVSSHQRTATVVGEVKWTNSPMPKSVLVDLRTIKIPALEQARIDVGSAEIIPPGNARPNGHAGM